MKKLLITGFDPFGGESINPSWEAVKLLPEVIGEFEVHRMEIPTVVGVAAQIVLDKASQISPDVILCVGQAGGREAVTPERVAINCMDARIPDNAGNQPREKPVISGGPDGIFSTVPVRKMADAIEEVGIPGKVSNTAGTFVCNDTLYRLLHHYAGTAVWVGFIHVPHLPQQAKAGGASMLLEDIIRGLSAAIGALG